MSSKQDKAKGKEAQAGRGSRAVFMVVLVERMLDGFYVRLVSNAIEPDPEMLLAILQDKRRKENMIHFNKKSDILGEFVFPMPRKAQGPV